jgi:predicted RNA-binding Zn ribbon-like protein
MHPEARVLTGGDGQRFTFDPGALCIDLMMSGGVGVYRKFEVLHSPEDLAAWLSIDDLRIEPDDLARIKHLRDTLWSVVPAIVEGRPVAPADIKIVNGYAGDAPRPHVDPDSLLLSWSYSGPQILGAYARDALEVIGTPTRRERLRECSGDNCKLVFLDTSRPGNRRWCSMERCGNRNKVRTHRARQNGERGR